VLHTAPLWPCHVPIQSPDDASRIMGILSWHAETRNVRPGSEGGARNWTSARGREWPGSTRGICFLSVSAMVMQVCMCVV
jgi:hypothetical protein